MDHTEEIDRYLNGGMSPAEKEAFERRLATDEALSKEFQFQQSIYNTLHDREALQFRQKLQAIRKQKETKQWLKTPIPKWRRILILLAFIGGGFYYWLSTTIRKPTEIPQNVTPQEKPDTLRASPPAVASHTDKPDTASPARSQPGTLAPSRKLLAFIEKQYQENLFSTIDRGNIRSNAKLNTLKDSLGMAFDRGNYRYILQIAKNFPLNDPSYNAVIWMAANAAFLENDCRAALSFSRKISELKVSKSKAQDAEMLLLLTYVKCGMTNDSHYKELLAACIRDKAHPAHQIATGIQSLTPTE